jgi:hypothetical protein
MNNKFDWAYDRISMKVMGKKWIVFNWCLIAVGAILFLLQLGSERLGIPAMTLLTASSIYMLVFIIDGVVLVAGNIKHKKIYGDVIGTSGSEGKVYGQQVIKNGMLQTAFQQDGERSAYGLLYLGIAIWLSIQNYGLLKVLFSDSDYPLTAMESFIPVCFLIVGAGGIVFLVVIGIKQLRWKD